MNYGSNNKKLTVVITTYNRKQPLLEQLRSLERQGHYEEYDIIISDNHSDYDVKEMIQASLSEEFCSIIKVERRPCNVGGDMNITLSFQLPTSEWMWLLSDDDITEPNSIEIVLDDIEKNKDNNVCWIKYSISAPFKPNIDFCGNNLLDIFNYYNRNRKSTGELIFISNNLYRMPYLQKYLIDICIYSDTCMPQALLPFFAIKKDSRQVLFSSHAITNYTPGRGSWAPIWAYLRFGNILTVTSMELNKAEIKAFKKLPFWVDRGLITSLASVHSRAQRDVFLKRIISNHYNFFSLARCKIVFYYCLMNVVGSQNWLRIIKRMHNRKWGIEK